MSKSEAENQPEAKPTPMENEKTEYKHANNNNNKKKKRKEFAPYGNYRNYYGYRVCVGHYFFLLLVLSLGFYSLKFTLLFQIGHDLDGDPRLKVFKKEWFEGKDCFDIGCNNGSITIDIGTKIVICPSFLLNLIMWPGGPFT